MKKLTLREIQLEELDMLKNITDFLDKQKIQYFLCGGTLLGAVRHKGFIPWDDDIDIFIPRKDYERFLKITENNIIYENYKVTSFEKSTLSYPFCKVLNEKISINSKSSLDKNLWIDVFPIDGYPDDYVMAKKLAKTVSKYKGIIYLHTTSFMSIIKEHKSLKNRALKIILKPLCMIIPIKYCSKRIVTAVSKCNYDDSEFVGEIVWGYGICERVNKKNVFSKAVKLNFENQKFNCPAGYDEYLSSIYGEYMTPPKMQNRVTHYIEAYKEED